MSSDLHPVPAKDIPFFYICKNELHEMKVQFFLILITLTVCCQLNAQTGIGGNERYNSYEQCIYVDNLAQELIPDIFVGTYYCKLKSSGYKASQFFDTLHKRRELHIRTNRAKDGYLFVNKSIMDKIGCLKCELDKMEVSYVYNNKSVRTKKEVKRVLRLREKHIQHAAITIDEHLGVIDVHILTK